jgi:hypothetical protein
MSTPNSTNSLGWWIDMWINSFNKELQIMNILIFISSFIMEGDAWQIDLGMLEQNQMKLHITRINYKSPTPSYSNASQDPHFFLLQMAPKIVLTLAKNQPCISSQKQPHFPSKPPLTKIKHSIQ